MSRGQLRIFIAEWIPSLNKGELAILQGMLETFEVLGNFEVAAISFQPSVDRLRYPEGVRIIDAGRDLLLGSSPSRPSLLNRIKLTVFPILFHIAFILLYTVLRRRVLRVLTGRIWREYLSSDVIVICHDQVGCVNGFILNYSPVYISLIGRVLRKPVVIYGNGTPPIQGRIPSMLARFVLSNVDLATVREAYSYRILRGIAGGKGRLVLTGDPAVLARPSDRSRGRAIMRAEGIAASNSIIMGATITRSAAIDSGSSGQSTSAKYKNGIRLFAKVFDDFLIRHDAALVFIPHCIEPHGLRDDRLVANDIYGAMREKDRVVVIHSEYSLSDLKALQGLLDIFVGARIHSVIGAISMGVPACTIARLNDVRASGLIGELLGQQRWIYYVENPEPGRLMSILEQLVLDSEQVRAEQARFTAEAKQKAMLNGLLLKRVLIMRGVIQDC